jgi:hypothetical protein
MPGGIVTRSRASALGAGLLTPSRSGQAAPAVSTTASAVLRSSDVLKSPGTVRG